MNKLDEKVKIHAHVCGDGCLGIYKTKRSKNDIIKYNRKNIYMTNYFIEYWNTEKKLLDSFQDSIDFVYNKSYQNRDNIRVQIRSKAIYFEMKNLGCGKSRDWKIPSFIKKSKRLSRVWIGCFCDDEAYVDKKTKKIRVACVNLKSLKDVFYMLRNLKIKSKLYGPYNKRTNKGFCVLYELKISDIERFSKLIKLEHPKKLSAIAGI